MVMFFNGTPAITPYNQAQDVVANDLLTDLIAAWELDEVSGTRADSHTNGYDLTDNNTVGSRTGIGGTGTAADFISANNEFLSRADNADLRAGDIDFTWEIWNIFDAPTSGATQCLISKEDADTNREYRLELFRNPGGNNVIRWVTFTSAGGVAGIRETTFQPSGATWYQIIVYHDATANEIGVVIDDTSTFTASTTATAGTSTASLRIGNRNGSIQPFDGGAQYVRYWKRLLTSAEITDLYNGGSGRPYSYFE